MNDDLQIGCERIAKILDPKYKKEPHPLTKLLASDPGIVAIVSFLEKAVRGNTPVRQARKTMRLWRDGGSKIPSTTFYSKMLDEINDLRAEVEHYKTKEAEHHYWALQTQEDCSPIQAASRLSKEELGRLPKNLTELRKEKL